MLLDVVVNGQRLREVVLAERTADGRVLLPLQAWTEARLKPPGAPVPLPDGGPGYALDAVAGIVYAIDRRNQALNVTAPPQAFVAQQIAGQDARHPEPRRPDPGVLVNYDATATLQSRASATAGAVVEGIAFGPLGSVVGNVLVNHANDRTEVRRLETFWQYDLPGRMETVIVGDTIGTGSGWSRPVRYGGLRWGTDFGLRPGFVTLPLPSLAGVAALPSTVEVLVNNQQRLSRPVPPGAFELHDIPVVTGAGELNLVVRDLLGRETLVRQSYYLSPRLLAQGLDDYSLEAGWLRTGYGTESDRYGHRFGSATWRRGLTPGLTAEVRGELDAQRRAAGLEVTGVLGTWGLGRASIAVSDTPAGSGRRLMLGLERSGPQWGGAVQWERYDAGFTQLAQSPDESRPRDLLIASTGGRLFGSVSAGLNFTRQRNWNADPVKLVTASISAPLPHELHLSFFYSRELTARGDWRGGLVLTRALGGGVFATASATRSSDGPAALDVRASSTTPSGPGLGWRMGASTDDLRTVHGGLSWNTTVSEFTADGEAGRAGHAAARFGLRGSAGRLAGLPFAARPIGRGSFAVVRVGEQPGVAVSRSHQVVTRTNEHGLAFVAGLLPYQPNVIEIDPAEVPLDAELGATRVEVTPYARSGVTVDFEVRRTRGALLQLVLPDGAPVPVEARVRALPAGASFPVARRGEVYMTGLEQSNRIQVSWPGHRCELAVQVPVNEPLPRIGPLTCAPGAAP